ncbi:hypothetical protein [Castellaniella sp.]|uniref:hypothetical protein n=1 Tax=Castellaniella sp. TaxID=1955812 RepID=UPI0035693252
MSFGQKRPTFKPTPYGYTRRSRGIPRWLLLLITGIVLGAGAVVFLQRSYGPQRLTVEQSEELRLDLNTTHLENQRLVADAKKINEEITQARQDQQAQSARASQLSQQMADMQASMSSLISAIPPDPRGGLPGIRGANMVLHGSELHYEALLIQDIPEGASEAPPFKGEAKFVGSGTWSNGNAGSVDLATVSFEMGLFTTLSGAVELPKGYRLRQVTVQITPDGADKISSTRTLKVAVAR